MVDNVKRLGPYRFICWTQSGFKKACRAVHDWDRDHDPIQGYPTVYPCVVNFVQFYTGYHYYHASCTPLDQAIEAAQAYHQQLVDADTEHRKQLEEQQ